MSEETRTPTVGRTVHYVSYGTPGGEYGSECRAAIVTDSGAGAVSLAVVNPTGLFFNLDAPYNGESRVGGTWHWPERDDS